MENNIFDDFEELDKDGNVVNKKEEKDSFGFEEIDNHGNVLNNSNDDFSVIENEEEAQDEEDELKDPKFRDGSHDNLDLLNNPEFLYLINKIYSLDVLENFKLDYYNVTKEMLEVIHEHMDIDEDEEPEEGYADFNEAIETIKNSDRFKDRIYNIELGTKNFLDDIEKRRENYKEVVRKEKEEFQNKDNNFHLAFEVCKKLGINNIRRPFMEFFCEGYSENKNRLLYNELNKENRDFSSIFVSDFNKFRRIDYPLNDYIKDYITFVNLVSKSKGYNPLTDNEIKNTLKNTYLNLCENISKKHMKYDLKYDPKIQEKLDNKSYFYSLSDIDRSKLIENTKNDILQGLDNKYDINRTEFLYNSKQKYDLMKNAIYKQSLYNKIFNRSLYNKQKNTLKELKERISSSLKISSKDYDTIFERDSESYDLFIKESRESYNNIEKNVKDIISDLKEDDIYKTYLIVDKDKIYDYDPKEINVNTIEKDLKKEDNKEIKK